ncbi:BZ3500_MvSof-1268-A1-R1_Chr3-1g05924 [Microbotryum saponariae]|uniref:BZ3500_MvSof-1268-A1-R1_Chr3-1g05924 protein n=1 Tax=Microbotryum saponariae TaxID=289078 RepID=A0A2X0KYL9_9BASI|nr:BZ3500_MvSof-1268-A1-R1_Chr3-1g05924 [Microbotryum saponariae]SDA05114.1 BZ3501_MvSof-1269-A2-R1_Chr3-1g05594 [Microbotryum saponariae]
MSAYDRFSSPGSELASFFRQLATPIRRYASFATSSSGSVDGSREWEWERLRAKHVGTTKRLDLFDHDLYGDRGAQVFLAALERSPGVETVNLSSNKLGDHGIMAITRGLKGLRSRGIGACLKVGCTTVLYLRVCIDRMTLHCISQEINLSGNNLTDVSFHLLALNLLQPSPHPPTVTHLYLTANDFRLSPSLAAFLGSCLSSPSSSLRCLSLTNNPTISSSGLLNLLQHLRLGTENPSQLSQLHLSVCKLTPDCAQPLARWLESPIGGGRLQALGLNGNGLSEAGVRRILRSVATGRAPSLVHVELFANELGEAKQTVWADVIAELEAEDEETDEERASLKDRFERAKEMNKIVLKETRLAALGLLAKARVLFGQQSHGISAISQATDRSPSSTSSPNSRVEFAPSRDYFAFQHLPIEIRIHILRCTLDARPSSTAHRYTRCPSEFLNPISPEDGRPVLTSPLTEMQFLSILDYSASRQTLQTEIRLASAQIPSLAGHHKGKKFGSAGFSTDPSRGHSHRPANGTGNGDRSGSATTGSTEDGEEVWAEWFLRATGCDRFQRS